MIETHKSLQATWQQLYDQLDEAESNAAEAHGRRPIALIHWRNYHIGGSEIDDRRESLLQEAEIPAATIEQEYLDVQHRLGNLAFDAELDCGAACKVLLHRNGADDRLRLGPKLYCLLPSVIVPTQSMTNSLSDMGLAVHVPLS